MFAVDLDANKELWDTSRTMQNPDPEFVPSTADRREAIMNAFRGEIEPVRVGFFYRFGMLLVAFAMLLLPLVYVGIIGIAGWVVYAHATSNIGMLDELYLFSIIAYFGPLLVGGILLVFMIKPLFARDPKEQKPYKVGKKGQQLLFDFVHRVCESVRAPMPAEIHLDCQVNASASFRRGIWSIFGGDLVLTIGMPLVAGTTLRQLAGILAHEFGHFSQGAGMRLTYLVRSVNVWFSRVVYERDAWDERLNTWCEEGTWHTILIFWVAKIFVWVSRGILWVLMWFGHFISCFMSRQMEYDADRYEARLAGSEVFVSSMRLLPMLGVANERTLDELQWSWEERKLVDDLSAVTLENYKNMPADVRIAVGRAQNEAKTGWLDTHPADMDRILAARELNAAGVFSTDLPASAVLNRFEDLSRRVSIAFYRQLLGDEVQPDHLLPAKVFLERQAAEEAGAKAAKRFFQDHLSGLRPLGLPGSPPGAPPDPTAAVEQLKRMREQVVEKALGYKQNYQVFDQADSRLLHLGVARGLVKHGLSISAEAFNVHGTDVSSLELELGRARDEMQESATGMTPYEELLRDRLLRGLGLLQVPAVANLGEGHSVAVGEIERLWPTLILLERHLPALDEMRTEGNVLHTLVQSLEDADPGWIIPAIDAQRMTLQSMLERLRRDMGDTLYPFRMGEDKTLLRDYLVRDVPNSGDRGEDLHQVLDACHGASMKMYSLYFRMLGFLAQVAERVEQAVGMDPLPEPQDQEPASH